MKIILTGSSGFIAGHIIKSLKEKSIDVLGVDIIASENTDIVVDSLDWIYKNLIEKDYLAIVNLAAITDTKSSVDFLEVNCNQVMRLRQHWPNIFIIQASSMLAEYYNFKSADRITLEYGFSKRIVEEVFRNDKRFLCVRFPMVYSKRGMTDYHVNKFKLYSHIFRYFSVKPAQVKKSMLCAEDIGRFFSEMIKSPENGMRYLCDDHLTSVEDLAFMLTNRVPLKYRLPFPNILLRLIELISPKIRLQISNAGEKYDFR